MAENRKMPNVTLEGVRIVFRNFSGKEGKYNREGDRNFSVLLPPELAETMGEDGWNIKFLQPREEGEAPQAYLQVSVNFKSPRPPRIVMISNNSRVNLGEEEVNILDWADITNVDMVVRPYQWEVNGKTGIKAYLQAIYATIEADELAVKYADVPDSAASSTMGRNDEPYEEYPED